MKKKGFFNSNVFFKGKFDLAVALLRWTFRPKQWIGKEVKYYGKERKITAENFNYIQLEGIEHPINKRNYPKLNEQLRRNKAARND